MNHLTWITTFIFVEGHSSNLNFILTRSYTLHKTWEQIWLHQTKNTQPTVVGKKSEYPLPILISKDAVYPSSNHQVGHTHEANQGNHKEIIKDKNKRTKWLWGKEPVDRQPAIHVRPVPSQIYQDFQPTSEWKQEGCGVLVVYLSGSYKPIYYCFIHLIATNRITCTLQFLYLIFIYLSLIINILSCFGFCLVQNFNVLTCMQVR